ncbi:MAG: hypothetical protein QM780_03385 [Hyphomicrobium sp.]|uniref:hypothetical protein n=1 Tax=Hyphomicrobium sp. TaxID=82 RepID=UPI0039E5991F
MTTDDLKETAKAVLAAVWRGTVIAIWTARELIRTAWRIVRGPLIAALNIIAALIILFEEWGWRPLSNLIGRLAAFAPIAALERLLARLPPYAALVALALPASLLFPLKLLAIWLLANEHFFSATLLFVGAKIASTALIARIFILVKPALMQIGWFAAAYNRFVPWKDALYAQIRASWAWRYGRIVKARVQGEIRKGWASLRPRVAEVWRRWTGRELPFSGGPRNEADIS